MKRIVVCCVLLLCATAVYMTACSPKTKPPANKSVPVVMAVATLRSIPVQMNAMGSVEAFATISVRTQITAQIAKVFFKEGRDVKKGDLLLTLDCRSNEAALAQAQANLARDIAQARYAKEQMLRYADLIKKDYVAKEQFDQIQANAVALEATVKADEAIVESNRVQMQYCSIYSPIDGRTGMLKVNQGNLVKVNDTEILTINQIQPINVTFAIPEKDLPMVKKYSMEKTLKIEAFIPGEERPENGELTFVDNAIDKSTGTITIKGTFANKEKRLVPGQFVNVVLTLTVQSDAVLVPSQGVEQGQTGQYVYVIGPDSTAEMRPVTIGGEIKGETVIVTGLKPGERIVTDGQMRLTPGAKVTMKTSK
jgi:membrane fusion protein, multidrug efflux system